MSSFEKVFSVRDEKLRLIKQSQKSNFKFDNCNRQGGERRTLSLVFYILKVLVFYLQRQTYILHTEV